MPDEPRDDTEPTEEELEERLRKLLGEAESTDEPDELDELEKKLLQLDEKLEQVSQGRREDDEDLDAEFDQRFQKLHEKVEAVKTRREAKAAAERRVLGRDRESAKGLGMGLTVAYMIIGVPLIGVAIGWLADRALGTNLWKGIGMLIGAVLGIFLTIMVLNRSDQKS